MSPSSPAGGLAGADTPYGSGVLATLYPACLGCRQQIDSLLASIDSRAVSYAGNVSASSPGAVGAASAGSRRDDRSSARLFAAGSSSGSRSTSSPAWPSGSGTVDGTSGDGGNVATQQRLLGLSQQLSRDVSRLCEAFERERSQLSQQQVMLWQRRITGLRDDAASLASTVHAELGSMQWWVHDEHKQREELLQLRGSRGKSRYGGGRSNAGSAMEKEDRAAARRWDHERREEQANELAWLREREKLQESGMMLETIFAQGRGVLDRVVQQNSVLRNARRKLAKLTSAAGVSSTLIRAAARRQASDRRLIYGGMLLTLAFFFLLYRFAHTYSFSELFLMGVDPTSVGSDVLETSVADVSQAMRR